MPHSCQPEAPGCFHEVPGGCAYCRSIVIADQGPDPDDRPVYYPEEGSR